MDHNDLITRTLEEILVMRIKVKQQLKEFPEQEDYYNGRKDALGEIAQFILKNTISALLYCVE